MELFSKKKKSFAPHFYGDTPKMTTFFLKAHQISEFEALIELDFFRKVSGVFFSFLNFFKNYAFVLLHFPEIPTWVKKISNLLAHVKNVSYICRS